MTISIVYRCNKQSFHTLKAAKLFADTTGQITITRDRRVRTNGYGGEIITKDDRLYVKCNNNKWERKF